MYPLCSHADNSGMHTTTAAAAAATTLKETHMTSTLDTNLFQDVVMNATVVVYEA